MIFISLNHGEMPVVMKCESSDGTNSITYNFTSSYAKYLAEQLTLIADQAERDNKENSKGD